MSYQKNLKTISILFNTTCILNNMIHFNISTFYLWDTFSRLFVDTGDVVPVLDGFRNENITSCIIDIDFEPIFLIADCVVEKTDQIFYTQNSTLIQKPIAWSIDYLDIDKDNKYTYESSNKEEVEIWILDTGINWHHTEFYIGQVIDMDPNYDIQNITHPHGTGTSICAGGLNYGSSKGFKIYNFPVCRNGGSCGSSDIDNAFKFITNRLKDNVDEEGKFKKRIVINLSVGASMGTDPSATALGLYYNEIFKILTKHGAIIVTSAGNSNQDACTWLYSFSPHVISVGALDKSYYKASFSNYGECVDIWCFGVAVPSGYSIKDNFYVGHVSGTSFSSPLMAGLVANVLSSNLQYTRDQVLENLYYKINNYIVPNYKCGSNELKCCQSEIYGTRKDKYCRSLDLKYCARNCIVKTC